jgi:HEPN domain-containing protein
MKSNRDLALDLTKKAEHDLRMAEIGLAHAAPLDTVAFHVQQTAEKILKALLASRDVEYPRTHNVEALLDLAVPLYPDLVRSAPRAPSRPLGLRGRHAVRR